MACMIEPLAPDEESRLLKTLSPNGIRGDFIEVRLSYVGNTQKIEFRQMRPNQNRELVKQRSVYLTLENWNEIQDLEDEMPEVEQT